MVRGSGGLIDPEFAHLPPEVALMRQREFERNYRERFNDGPPEPVIKQTLSEEYDWVARQKRLEAKYGPTTNPISTTERNI